MLGALPVMQRAVLVLRYYEDLADADIAAILGCSAATVRVHAFKALNRLRSRLAGALISAERSNG
jgi:RNA polymerase sigma factor (sigma-70 family)